MFQIPMETLCCRFARAGLYVSFIISTQGGAAPHKLAVPMLETSDLRLVLEALGTGGGFLLNVHIMLQNLEG